MRTLKPIIAARPTYGRLTPRSSAALRKSGYFRAGNGNFGQVCARRLLRAVALVTIAPGRAGQKCLRMEVAKCRV